MTAEWLPDPIAIAVSFTSILEELGIPWLVGGSLASSVHGEPRSTNDIDVIADLRPGEVERFVRAVDAEYYVSGDAINEAIATAGSFNLIHIAAAIKIDVFLVGDDPFNVERLRHRQRVSLQTDRPAALYIDTAEHSILRKLEWYRRGGDVSERQWRDVAAMLRIQGAKLDNVRLDHWAAHLRVSDLLARARREAGVGR